MFWCRNMKNIMRSASRVPKAYVLVMKYEKIEALLMSTTYLWRNKKNIRAQLFKTNDVVN